jgi:hypothetical protein
VLDDGKVNEGYLIDIEMQVAIEDDLSMKMSEYCFKFPR